MSSQILEKIIQEADELSPQEQLRLAAHLIERASQAYPEPRPQGKWSEIRGMAAPSLFGEDAQSHISRTRREAGES